jgi:hypothetical protein
MSYPAAVRQHALNQRLVDALIEAPYAEVVRVTDALWSELPRGQDWLRWNGAGDLTPGACRVINCFTRRHADIALWVITRKPLEVARLKDRKSLRLLLSLDHSTPKAIANELRLATTRFKRGVARLAYTRVDEDDVPPSDVWVVFNKHVGGRRYDWNDTTGTTCHATLPGVTHEGACDPCRRCFLPRSINP